MLTLKLRIPKLPIPCRMAADDERDISKAAAEQVRGAVMRHFLTLGGRQYWGQAAAKTVTEARGREVFVNICQRGVALRYRGGVVLPGKGASSVTGAPTKLLSIPASESVNNAPGWYKPLVFIPVKKGHLRGLLFPGEAGVAKRSGKKRKKGSAMVRTKEGAPPYFRLVDRTIHQANPQALPSMAEMQDAAAKGARMLIKHKKLK